MYTVFEDRKRGSHQAEEQVLRDEVGQHALKWKATRIWAGPQPHLLCPTRHFGPLSRYSEGPDGMSVLDDKEGPGDRSDCTRPAGKYSLLSVLWHRAEGLPQDVTEYFTYAQNGENPEKVGGLLLHEKKKKERIEASRWLVLRHSGLWHDLL